MSSSRFFAERALNVISRASTQSQATQPLTRGYGILRPTKRTITPSARIRCPDILLANRTTLSRQTTRKFWANGSRFSSNPTPHLGSPQPAPSLSQRLRKLSREYGWSAVGVYFALSALDFPFCFLAVRLLGTERIGRWEHVVIGAVWDVIRIPFPDFVNNRQAAKQSTEAIVGPEDAAVAEREGSVGWSSGMAQAQADNVGNNASMCSPHHRNKYTRITKSLTRHLDPARTRLRYS
jgi:hypothetical protein